MNLVQTIPELQNASLNGIKGVGYAEITSTPQNGSECRGVIVFDNKVDAASFVVEARACEVTYHGIVYRDGFETIESIPVDILFFNNDPNQEPGATFVAKGG